MNQTDEKKRKEVVNSDGREGHILRRKHVQLRTVSAKLMNNVTEKVKSGEHIP